MGRRPLLLAFLLALALHGAALWVLVDVALVDPLAPAPAAEAVEITFVEPAPAPPPAPLEAGSVPKAVEPRAKPPRTRRGEPLGGVGGLARAPGPPAPADDEPAPPVHDEPASEIDDEPFPRHAYGKPPPAPAPSLEPPPSQPPSPAPSSAAPSIAPELPRATKKRSLLDRVTQGFGPAGPGGLPGGDVVDRLVKEAPPPETEGDRAKANVQRWAGLSSTPNDGLQSRPLRYDTLLTPDPEGGYAYKTDGWQARIFPDGKVVFDGDIASYEPGKGHPMWDALGIPNADLTSGTFDATDTMMRIAKLDPYAAAKQCFLDDTEPIRDELRSAWERQHLEAAIAQLGRRLDELWTEARPVAERRAAIFELYDSCSTEEAGQVARRVILSFVRRRLPAGSVDAYPRDELLRLNDRRTQDIAFDPYGDLVADGG